MICVLGCRVGSAALVRRATAARDAFFARGAERIMACGGRAWGGRVEADALAEMLAEGGVAPGAIVRERCSLDTRDNARFAAALLGRRGLSGVVLVTCAWHLPRAARLFRAAGLDVEGVAVEVPDATLLSRAYVRARERVSSWQDALRPVRLA